VLIVLLPLSACLSICLALAQLVKALATPKHVRSYVQEARVRSPERTSWTLLPFLRGK